MWQSANLLLDVEVEILLSNILSVLLLYYLHLPLEIKINKKKEKKKFIKNELRKHAKIDV